MAGSAMKVGALDLFKLKAFSLSLSSLSKLLISLSVFFLFLGCSDKGGGNNDDTFQKLTYTVNFYDDNLDFINSTKTDIDNPTINLPELNIELNINAQHLYEASSSIDVSGETAYTIIKDTNLYTVPNVIEIRTQAELDDIRNNLAGKYILMNDIELVEGEAGFDANGWQPIGDGNNYFRGVFNGNFHKITNLWINRPNDDFVGLFGFIEGAQTKNLGIEIAKGKNISGKSYVGSITGYVYESLVSSSYSTGDISGHSRVGGIAGEVYQGSISNSYSTGDISGSGFYYAGGIAGYVGTSNISNSYSTGDISGSGFNTGGIAGYAGTSKISNSYSTGNINGNSEVGGIAGGIGQSNISNSYSIGNINGNEYVSGIVGYVYSGSIIQNSAAVNPAINGTSSVNRIAGRIDSSTISNNFALDAMSIIGVTNGDAGTPKTIGELTTKSTYENNLSWSFGDNDTNPWKIEESKNNGLPYLYWQDL